MTKAQHISRTPQWDSVSLAVINSRLEAIPRKMTNTLFRAARSTVLNTCRDFSCCLVTKDDELLVVAESQPIHTMVGPDLMSRSMKQFHPVLHRGDAFYHNSPYDGDSHAGDCCIVLPIIDDDGNHHATAIVKAHLADVGNSQPTTLFATARDVYEEGALIFPCVKIQSDYKDVEDIIRMCQRRIRVPDFWYGDYLAMLGAARIAERDLLALGAEVGWDTFHRHTADWFDYSEQLMIDAIRAMPSGKATLRDRFDPLPFAGLEEGIPLEATIEVKSREAIIEIDFTNNPDCVPAGVNLSEACAATAAMVGIFNGLGRGVPNNGGSYRRLKIRLRENCVAGIPRHPASCSTATSGVSARMSNLVQMGIAELGDGLGMAACGLECPASTCTVSGHDPRRDDVTFVDMQLLGFTGGAGNPFTDGWQTSGEVGAAGNEMRDSTEIDEFMRPVIIWEDEIIADTEGAGRLRGAASSYVEFGPAGTELEVCYTTDGFVYPARGVCGGFPGGTTKQYKRSVDGSVEPAPPNGDVILQDGETIIAVSCAGGGYGPPWERDVERVRKDCLEGWITRERAESVYGVSLAEDESVDQEATQERRQVLRSGPRPAEEELAQQARAENAALLQMIRMAGDERSRSRLGAHEPEERRDA